MNFLAHLHLSGDYPQLLVGNFIADFLKGRLHHVLPEGIERGIRLHRAIDSFTDKHPIVRQGTKRLHKSYGKYAPVVIDVFYDHFLAKNWLAFHEQSLPVFAQDTYQTLQTHYEWLPPKVRLLLPQMISQDWLSNYAVFYGIEKALEGLSKRASFANTMHDALYELELHYEVFNEEFMSFFPEIIAHARPFLEEAKVAEGK